MGVIFIGLPVLMLLYFVATQFGGWAAIGVAVGLVALERFIKRVLIPLLKIRLATRHRQPPRVMALTKASDGAGMLALAAVVVSVESFAAVSSTPALWIPIAVMTAWGGLWLVTSGLAFNQFGWQGPLDTVLIVRALVKITVGGVGLFYIPAGPQRIWIAVTSAPNGEVLLWALMFLAAWIVAFWCVVTGSTKLLLMLATQIRPRPKAPADPSTHGKSGFASAAEGSSIMQGQGRRSRMEGVKF